MPDTNATEALLSAVDLARETLAEITSASMVGALTGHIIEAENIVSLLFECLLPGYPGWCWTVTITRIDGDETPSVLEAELMPGKGALLAPPWIPWSERLADYHAQEKLEAEILLAASESNSDESGPIDLDDIDDIDEDDIDIDELDIIDDEDLVDINLNSSTSTTNA